MKAERSSALGILDLYTLGEVAVQEQQRRSFDIKNWLIVGVQNKAVRVEQ